MENERLEYLIHKCRIQLNIKRNSQARVWLEMALEEFPNSRKLQRFAGKAYLQLGMIEKAINFLDSDLNLGTSKESTRDVKYDHDAVTQADLILLQEQFNVSLKPSFTIPSCEDIDQNTIRKTLYLNNITDKNFKKNEAENICTDRSGLRNIVVKRLKTKKISQVSEPTLNNYFQLNTATTLPFCDTDATPSESTSSQDIGKPDDVSQLASYDFNHTKETNHVISASTDEQIRSFDNSHSVQNVFEEDSHELGWEEDFFSSGYIKNDAMSFDIDIGESDVFDITDDAFPFGLENLDINDNLEETQLFFDIEDSENTELSRWERAQQVAVEVIYSTNWSGKNLDFLTDVFFESGWGSTRVTLEKEILSGTTIDELKLARDFKEIWKNCDRYWITMSKLGSINQTTDAAYKQMSWSQALKIIRCFNWLPSIEELEVFLDDEFEYWYQHSLMRRVFPIFMKYLCYYRTKSGISLDFELGPYQPFIADDPLDKGDFINCNSENYQKLSAMGIDSIVTTIS
ncbi:tetratricopeptide repeat protein [Aeromonas enteropelogenes]|uniref:tetratricopeptide repeat protein n=1 Tax=Aeromonas enteropelogenes TaxID=29489 RepID=UPI003B9DF70C